MENSEKYSVLSKATYWFHDNPDYDEVEKKIESYGLENYKIDRELSDDESLVLFNDQGNEVTLAVRGTDPTILKDLHADAQIAVGMEGVTERFTGEFEKFEHMREKYPYHKHTVTGHSLGGNISYKIGRKYNVPGHHFSTGSSFREAGDQIQHLLSFGGDTEAMLKQHFYTTGRDPISFMSHPLSIGLHHIGLGSFNKNLHIQYRPRTDHETYTSELRRNLGPIIRKKYDLEDYISHGLEHFMPPKLPKFIKGTPQSRIKRSEGPIARDYCRDNPNDKRCKNRKS